MKKSLGNGSSRDLSLDIARIMATIFVVCIHISDSLIVNFTKISPDLWGYVNFFEGFVRSAVPIFFMITGALLLQRDEPWKVFYDKRFIRMVGLYAVWTIIYTLFVSAIFGGGLSIGNIISSIASFNVYYHFWFFEPLFAVYLVIPVIRMLSVSEDGDIPIIFATVVWFIGVIGMKFVNAYTGSNLNVFEFFGLEYVGYLLVGHLLYSRFRLKCHKNRVIGGIMFGVGSMATAYLMCSGYNFISDTYLSYPYSPLSINIFVSSVGLFLLLISCDFRFKENFALRKLSNISFGVFLIHPMVISCLMIKGFDVVQMNSLLSYIAMMIVVCIVSYGVSYLISVLPIGRKFI